MTAYPQVQPVNAAQTSVSSSHGPKKSLLIALAIVTVVAAFLTNGFGIISPMVRFSTNDYSWHDLKRISEEIEKAPTDAEGLKIAERYHLCTSDGRLDGTQTKDVTLSDGTKTSVQIAGFRHDDRSDGTGRAGITFIFKDVIASQPMNSDESNDGGWQASQMRSWLASSGMSLLPDDLRQEVVSVRKLTNNTGETKSTSSATSTDDSLWLFSYNELSSDYSQWDSDYLSELGSVYKAEGSTYQLFTDTGNDYAVRIKNYQGQASQWWERSPGPYFSFFLSGYFRGVGSDGNPSYRGPADGSNGVVPGFCI